MMNFPESPTVGQQFPPAPAPPSYVWDGVKWGQPGYAHFYVERGGDTMTGPLALPAAPAPVAANAVRKDYVDAAIGAIPAPDLTTKVSKTGDTMSGTLTIAGADLRSYRVGGGTGVLYMSSGDNYLYWNGTNFQLSNALAVSGQVSGSYIKAVGDGDRARWRGDTWSVVTHQNSGSWYLMATDNGAPDAGWNGLRPFRLDHSSGNISMEHTVNITGTLTLGSYGQFNQGFHAFCRTGSTLNYGGSGNVQIESDGGGSDAFISFHRAGSYGVNFGLGNDNTLRWGGWSAGGNYWRLWSERDFGNPFANGTPVVDGRLVHAGDPGVPYNGMWEPYGGAVCTGCGGGAPVGYYVIQSFRMRYMQLRNGGWWTLGYA